MKPPGYPKTVSNTITGKGPESGNLYDSTYHIRVSSSPGLRIRIRFFFFFADPAQNGPFSLKMDRFFAGSAFLKTKYCHFDQFLEELDPDPYIGIQLDPDPQKKIRIRNPAPHIIKRFHLINVLSHQM